MPVKDMSLKKSSFVFLFLIIFFFKKISFANQQELENIIDYLDALKFFSVSFIQNDGNSLSEGKIYIGSERIRVEYNTPTKILIILDKDKAMYYNHELDEDEFFDPKDTKAWFFFEIFNDPELFYESNVTKKDNYIILEKEHFDDNNYYLLKVHFENNPLLIRKIQLFYEDSELLLSIFDHKYNEDYDKKFFKLINPNFFN